MVTISIKTLQEINACKEARDWFLKTFGEGEVELTLENMQKCKHYDWISWLIESCSFAQTQEMLQYYKSLEPDYEDVKLLIRNCSFAQTQEMLQYYKSLEPSYKNVSWLIESCKFAKNNWEKA